MLYIYLSMIESEEDKNKFLTIYKKYRVLIYYEAHKITKDPYMVDDIAQETFMKIIKYLNKLRYENEKEFAGLVVIMTKHCGLDLLRRSGKYVYPDIMPERKGEIRENEREKVVLNYVTLHEVMKVIENMDPRYSVPLRLKVYGYTSEEISGLLDISPENARVRIYRAKKMILEMVER